MEQLKIAVAGTGYVGLSIATLLAQHHNVMAVDIVPEKVELINNRKSPIQDEYIEKYLAEEKLDARAWRARQKRRPVEETARAAAAAQGSVSVGARPQRPPRKRTLRHACGRRN